MRAAAWWQCECDACGTCRRSICADVAGCAQAGHHGHSTPTHCYGGGLPGYTDPATGAIVPVRPETGEPDIGSGVRLTAAVLIADAMLSGALAGWAIAVAACWLRAAIHALRADQHGRIR